MSDQTGSDEGRLKAWAKKFERSCSPGRNATRTDATSASPIRAVEYLSDEEQAVPAVTVNDSHFTFTHTQCQFLGIHLHPHTVSVPQSHFVSATLRLSLVLSQPHCAEERGVPAPREDPIVSTPTRAEIPSNDAARGAGWTGTPVLHGALCTLYSSR